MENNIQNKAKFIAQYWGQKVEKWNNKLNIVNTGVFDEYDLKYNWLELTPLSQISDEDKYYKGIFNKHTQKTLWAVEQNDYLRSKGYALPFNGLSVEKQIEYGWVKLKNNEK